MNSAFAALLIVAAPAASAEPRRLPPIDQCAAEPGFAAFRAQLEAAIAARSVPRLMALVADDIRLDQADGAGKAQLRKLWGLDRRGPVGLWTVMGEALAMGCARDQGMLIAPSFRAQYDDERDPYTIVLVRPGTALHVNPSRRAAVIATLDWHTVEALREEQNDGWLKVRLSDGSEGYIDSGRARSLFEPRLEFEKRDGHWRIAGFRSYE